MAPKADKPPSGAEEVRPDAGASEAKPGDATDAKPANLTPAQWAERKGIAPKADPNKPWIEPVSSDFRYPAADVLHGWSHHAFHYQDPKAAFLISEQDFDKALEAAAGYPACGPHEPAVAEHCPFKKEFKARKDAETAATKAAEEAAKKEQA